MGRWTHVISHQEHDEEARRAAALAVFDAKLAALAAREKDHLGRRNLWLAHHWPDDYADRCVVVRGRHVCRRCFALYPLGLLVAVLSAAGSMPWPEGADPAAIWLLSIPATIVYCAEAIGLTGYHTRLQVGTTLLAALAFGRALGYELLQRWSTEFWGPIAVFGGVWFLATAIGHTRKRVAGLR